jgi:transcriptional regulator with XRE-family HTH domain
MTNNEHRNAHCAAQLRQARLAKGLSILQLAQAAKVTPGTIYAYERGIGLKWSTVCILAQALGLTLVTYQKNPNP